MDLFFVIEFDLTIFQNKGAVENIVFFCKSLVAFHFASFIIYIY